MIEFNQKEFWRVNDRDSAAAIVDTVFDHCSFYSCGISITLDPEKRSRATDILFRDCIIGGCNIWAATLDNVIVDGLITRDPLQLWGIAFRHVVFRGRIGTVIFNDSLSPGIASPEIISKFIVANEEWYKTVDWALDISAAEFEQVDFRGAFPVRLVRRDPDTQMLIRRESLLDGRWRDLDMSGTYWPALLERFLKSGEPDLLAVAPKRHRHFQRFLQVLRDLEQLRIAEP